MAVQFTSAPASHDEYVVPCLRAEVRYFAADHSATVTVDAARLPAGAPNGAVLAELIANELDAAMELLILGSGEAPRERWRGPSTGDAAAATLVFTVRMFQTEAGASQVAVTTEDAARWPRSRSGVQALVRRASAAGRQALKRTRFERTPG